MCLQKCKHANIIKLTEVLETEEAVILVMDHFDGIDGLKFLESRPEKKLSEVDALSIVL